MKRFITYLVCSLFVVSLSGNVTAVEKKDKKPVKKQVVLKKKAPTKKSVKSFTTRKGKVVRKKYDNFVDRNKNGIDDRKENLKQKPVAKTSKKKEEKKK